MPHLPKSAATRRRSTRRPARKHQKHHAPNIFNLRVDPDTSALIERARSVLGLNRTEFMLTSARVRAQEVLLSQTYLTLSDDDWAKFQAELEAPPAPTPELIALMASTPPWNR
jgi:uncharacterized protein (DUF1778 family)